MLKYLQQQHERSDKTIWLYIRWHVGGSTGRNEALSPLLACVQVASAVPISSKP